MDVVLELHAVIVLVAIITSPVLHDHLEATVLAAITTGLALLDLPRVTAPKVATTIRAVSPHVAPVLNRVLLRARAATVLAVVIMARNLSSENLRPLWSENLHPL